MTMPRQILPGSTYLVSRRCSERRFFLKPDSFVGQVFLYVLGCFAAAMGLELHVVTALSNHYHMLVTDVEGRLPRLLARLHRLVAMVVKAERGISENVWSTDKTSVVRAETPEDALDALVYVRTQAARAGLVERSSEWPGLSTAPRQLLDPAMTVARPDAYFSSSGNMPEQSQVCFTVPPGFEHMTPEEFVQLVEERVAAKEAEYAAKRAAEGRKVLGVKAIMAQNWWDAPSTPAPNGNLKPEGDRARRAKVYPHIKAKDKTVRLAALNRRRKFLMDYRKAFARWLNGHRRTRFPAGTYMLAQVFSVATHPPP